MSKENSNIQFQIDDNDEISLSKSIFNADNTINNVLYSGINEEIFERIVHKYIISNEINKFTYVKTNSNHFLFYKLANNKCLIPNKLENNLKQCGWKEKYCSESNAYLKQLQNKTLSDFDKKELSIFQKSNEPIVKNILNIIAKNFKYTYNFEFAELWLSSDQSLFLIRLLDATTVDYYLIIGLTGENIENIANFYEDNNINYRKINKNIKKYDLHIQNFIKTELFEKPAYKFAWKYLSSAYFEKNDFNEILKSFQLTSSSSKTMRRQYSDLYTNHLHTYFINRLFYTNYNSDILDKLKIDNKYLISVKCVIDGSILMLIYQNGSFVEQYLVDNSDYTLIDKEFIENNQYYKI